MPIATKVEYDVVTLADRSPTNGNVTVASFENNVVPRPGNA